VDELTRDRSAMSLEAANREVYLLLKEGIKVSVPETDATGKRAHLIRPAATFSPARRRERRAEDGAVARDGLGTSGEQ